MSQEDVELAEEGLAALKRTYKTGDPGAWAQLVERICDPEIVLETGTSAFTEGEWRGHEGAVGFVANQMEVLEDMWIEVDEIREVGHDRLVILIGFGGRARHTGIDVALSPGHVLDLRDGRFVRWRIFADHAQALEPAGLSE